MCLAVAVAKAKHTKATHGERRRETMTKILDSGNRTEFETGAVRDVQQGKGRFDLMPLDIMSKVFEIEFADEFEEGSIAYVLKSIAVFSRQATKVGCVLR